MCRCARLECDENCKAVIHTLFALTHAGITFDDESVVLKCAEVGEAGKIGSYLRADALSEPRTLSLKHRPARCFVVRRRRS